MSTYPVQKITNHVAAALQRLLTQYSVDRAPVIRAFVSAHAQQWQDLEDAFWDLLTEFAVSTAFGAQLDVIGKWVGQRRNGSDDEAYRGLLLLRIAEINSFGTSEELIAIFSTIMGGANIKLDEFFPAKFQLTANGGAPIIPIDQIIPAILECKAAGVGFVGAVWVPPAPNVPFVFEGDPSGLGFGYTLAGEPNQYGGSYSGDL